MSQLGSALKRSTKQCKTTLTKETGGMTLLDLKNGSRLTLLKDSLQSSLTNSLILQERSMSKPTLQLQLSTPRS